MTRPDRSNLQELREALLALHKTLLDSERIGYEQTFGTIPSAQEFLKLLLNDPWFVWLKPLSSLIVTLDEALDAKEERPAAEVEALFTATKQLLVASETGEDFAKHFDAALQRDPDVILAQAAVSRVLTKER
jgi:hypothetical protein